MEGPAATIALVLAETAAGGTALLWLGGLWGRARRGFFRRTGLAALSCGGLATLAASSAATTPVGEAARLAVLLCALTSAVLGLSAAALILRLDVAGRALGLLGVPTAAAMLGGFATVAGSGFVPALLQLLAGAVFLGAVLDGLLLGHWYLTDRRLPRDHIRRLSLVLLVALALGMVACTALIAVLIRVSLRGQSARAVQGATGFFYLAVITALTAETAAKVGFLG